MAVRSRGRTRGTSCGRRYITSRGAMPLDLVGRLPMPRRRKSGRRVNASGRSEGEGQYAPLPYVMLQSPAWRSLGGRSAKVFLELRCRFHGGNNGKLALSLDQAARLLSIGKATVQAAFSELS